MGTDSSSFLHSFSYVLLWVATPSPVRILGALRMCEEQLPQGEKVGLEMWLAWGPVYMSTKTRRLSTGSASTLLLLHVENITVYFLKEEGKKKKKRWYSECFKMISTRNWLDYAIWNDDFLFSHALVIVLYNLSVQKISCN